MVCCRHRRRGLSVALDLTSGGTFTRSTEGSYRTRAPSDGSLAFLAWAAANARRIEDRGDGLGPMLLMEDSRTNYLVQSRDASNNAWNAATGGTQSYDAGPGPDGAILADECIVPSGTQGRWQSAPAQPVGTHMVASTWVRRLTGTGNAVISVNGSSVVSSPSTPITTLYQRIEAQNGSDGTGLDYFIPWDGIRSGPQAVDYLADLHQMEAGWFPSSPIRTGGANATRGADVLAYAVGQYPDSFRTRGLVLKYAPDWSSAEAVAGTLTYRIAGLGGGTNLVQFSANALLLYQAGAPIATLSGLTWSRGQLLTVTLDFASGKFSVAGATAGNGTATFAAAPWAAANVLSVGQFSGLGSFGRFAPTIVGL